MYQYNVPQILIMYPDGTGSRLLTELDIALYEKEFTKFGGVAFDDCLAEKVFIRTLMKVEDGAVFYREVRFLSIPLKFIPLVPFWWHHRCQESLRGDCKEQIS